MSSASATPFRVQLGGGAAISPLVELLRWAVRKSDHTLPALLLALIDKVPWETRASLERAAVEARALQRELADLIGPSGIMLYPSFSRVAPRHYRPLLRPFDFVYTALFNVMQFPVTQVPLGLNRDGLPLGVQVASVPGNDHLTIAVALELEKRFGGWVAPNFP